MTERECRTGIRRYRSRSEAEQLVGDFEASGLTRSEFCGRNRVALNTFNRYMQRYGNQLANRSEQLVAVEVIDPAGFRAELAVVLQRGRRVEVARGFDPATLQQVVAVLEEL